MSLNLRWAWLRAVEWINWPSFITQPVVPVVLYFFDWWWMVLAVVALGYVWSATVVPWFV